MMSDTKKRRAVPKGVEVYDPSGTCDMNPAMFTMGECVRGYCNECRQPVALHLTPEEWDAYDDDGGHDE
jgi:hypothetical protein